MPPLRDALADRERRGGHDVEIAGVGGQVVRGSFDLEKHRCLEPRVSRAARNALRTPRSDALELHLLLEAVSGDVALYLALHRLDRVSYPGRVRRLGEREDRIAHQQRRL